MPSDLVPEVHGRRSRTQPLSSLDPRSPTRTRHRQQGLRLRRIAIGISAGWRLHLGWEKPGTTSRPRSSSDASTLTFMAWNRNRSTGPGGGMSTGPGGGMSTGPGGGMSTGPGGGMSTGPGGGMSTGPGGGLSTGPGGGLSTGPGDGLSTGPGGGLSTGPGGGRLPAPAADSRLARNRTGVTSLRLPSSSGTSRNTGCSTTSNTWRPVVTPRHASILKARRRSPGRPGLPCGPRAWRTACGLQAIRASGAPLPEILLPAGRDSVPDRVEQRLRIGRVHVGQPERKHQP